MTVYYEMLQKKYTMLFITKWHWEKWYHNYENWSQPCGLASPKIGTCTKSREEEYKGEKISQENVICNRHLSHWETLQSKVAETELPHLPALDQP